jgi:putative component of toxin-antitoxin plasmid stabilization module
MYEVEEYAAEGGTSPFAEWLNGLKDNRARMRLLTRLDRAALGNLGDWRILTEAQGDRRVARRLRPRLPGVF